MEIALATPPSKSRVPEGILGPLTDVGKQYPARQRAGILERVVKYDHETVTKTWDYLGSSSNDGEDA